MSSIIEIYYRLPVDHAKEMRIAELAGPHGGRLDFREEVETPKVCSYVCLTYEYYLFAEALAAAESLRACGFHVEGPSEYGENHTKTEQRADANGS